MLPNVALAAIPANRRRLQLTFVFSQFISARSLATLLRSNGHLKWPAAPFTWFDVQYVPLFCSTLTHAALVAMYVIAVGIPFWNSAL
jgi:hypothetical protein